MNKYQIMLDGWRARHNLPLVNSYDDYVLYRFTFGNGATLELFLSAAMPLLSHLDGFDTSDEVAAFMAEQLAATTNEVLVAIEPVVE